uniref:Reverse transcriptase domain-containing protein n=4 Tax=Meloidogyne TaxID=189290 RepID=A0A6V7VJZ9_MELEN|nr:unnamed protein product [Meloidogyne enterolobii]CAD2172536.1 unnamed protein product [Meloidogyne enterolobii]CAD2175257.1 unnamed protein product [Meloidogyne enterolobii]
MLSETWVRDTTLTADELSLNAKYQVYLSNRSNNDKKKGGGVAILIRSDIPSKKILAQNKNGYELIIVDLLKPQKVRLFCVYLPPKLNKKINNHLIKCLEDNSERNSIIVGDFNMPGINWNNKHSNTLFEAQFLEFSELLDFKQYIQEPTHIKGSTLDLLLSNSNNLICNHQIRPSFSTSDHFLIYFKLNIRRPSPEKILVRDITVQNLNKIKPLILLTLDNIHMYYKVAEKENFLCNTINEIITNNIPTKSINSRHKLTYPKYIRKAINDKFTLFRKLNQLSKTDDTNRIEYNRSCKRVKYLIRNYQNIRNNRIMNNHSLLRKYIRNNTKPIFTIPILLHENRYIANNKDKCQIFGQYFSQLFQNVPTWDCPKIDFHNKKELNDIDFDIINVVTELTALPNKNSSFENISYKILKTYKDILAPDLCEIFRDSLDSGEVPCQWKRSYIVPVYKKGEKSDCTNYRPISLTSPICRIFEKILTKEILNFMINNKLISNYQHGFMPNRCTTTQLIYTMEKWYKSLLEKSNTDVIYIDYKKAFDSVPIDFLLNKLYSYGIRGKIHRWIKNFLKDRTFKVKIGNDYSDEHSISSGVPQGTVIGPLLFIIYINDVVTRIGQNVSIAMFADDIKLTFSFRNESECHALQNAVNNLVDWNTIWGLNVSLDKTVIFHIGNKNPKFNYYVNNNELPKADIVKDLGVITNNKLTFEEHINHVRNISMLRSVQLLRNIKSTNPKIWGNYFKMYVLPLLEYASPVWNPSLKKSIKYIERVQKFYTRMALRNCKILRKISYDRRLDMLNLEPLYLRRFKIDLITLYKIVFRHTNINPLELFTFNQRPSRKHSYIINIPHKTSKTHNSFTNRIIKIWNSLPKEALNNSTITSFKLWLINNLKNVLSKHITL